MKLTNEQKGASLVVASALSYGFIYYFGISIIKENYSPYTTMFWRFSIAAVFLFLLLLPRIKKISFSPKEISSLLFTGAPFHGAATSLYFVSASHIGGGLAGVLLFTHPVTVLLFNRIIHKTEIAKICYLAFIFIICGVLLLADLRSANFSLIGILVGILSSIFFGLYIVSSKKSKLDPLLSAFVICCGCVVTCFIFAMIHGSFAIPTTFKTWFNVCCLALICTSLPIMLFLTGLKLIPSEKAAIISMLEPLLTMFVAYLFLQEKIGATQFLGALIILTSAVVVIIQRKKTR